MAKSRTPSYGVPSSFEKHVQGSFIGRHRHTVGHVTLVLSGNYEEHGDGGRLQLGPGDVIVHRPFEAHQNIISPQGATMITFEGSGGTLQATRATIDDPDQIARLSERNTQEAYLLLKSLLRPTADLDREDWPDLLASWLSTNPRGRISQWAERMKISREAVARGFRKAFGVDPVQFRCEVRARLALEAVRTTRRRLCDIATERGFSDQAHMTRSILALSGRTPHAWRNEITFIQDRVPEFN